METHTTRMFWFASDKHPLRGPAFRVSDPEAEPEDWDTRHNKYLAYKI
jgi:hypothetical protein